jgi:OPA family glycerol-3-phosphate transporter-like MFS transporter
VRSWQARIFVATWVAYAGYYFCRKPFFVVKGTLTDTFSWSPSELATIGTAYLIAYALGQFVTGALGTALGPRVVLLLGIATSIACNVAFGFANSLQTFAVLMFVNGLAQASGWAPTVGTMANWFGRAGRGTVMGWWNTHFTVGAIASNTLAAWALGAYGWRWSFFTGAMVLLAAWVVVLAWHRDRPEDVGLAGLPPEPGEPPDDGKLHMSSRVLTNVLLMGLFYFCAKFIRYALWSWVPWVLQHNFELRGNDAGYLSTVFDLAGAVGAIGCGYASDRWFGGDRILTALVSLGAMVLSTALLAWGGATSLPLFAVGLALVGFTLYGPDSLVAGAGAIEVGNRRTAVMAAATINGMGSLGSVAQELILGRLLDHGDLQLVLATLFGSALVSIVMLAIVWLRSEGRTRATASPR